MAHVPQFTLHMIIKLMFNFFWFGCTFGNKIHLERWDRLSKPKMIGVGILRTYIGSVQLCVRRVCGEP